MIAHSTLPSSKIMYNALLHKESAFDGIFYAGIKTTGIFCRPTCTARKPKPENVDYFASVKDALNYGYRPCKVCKPLSKRGETPDWIKSLLDEVHENPSLRLKDQDLRDRQIEPVRLRRWFKKNYDMTFQAYQRSLRINQAFGRIRQGDTVIESAFEHGYESLSGFADSFKKSTGFAPSASKEKRMITITRITTPLGPMLAGATENAICLFEFTDREMLETQIERVKKQFKSECISGTHPLFDQLQQEMDEYFNQKRKVFDVPIELNGTEFQNKVWTALLDIPFGQTRSYHDQAVMINNPKAIRAVGTANGDNRIAIIVPCHRVIGKDGKLTGYGGGLWRKQYLLNLEQGLIDLFE